MKPREFWFDLETTSDNEPVVNVIHFEKPEYEADHHVIEHKAFTELLEQAKKLAEAAIIGIRHYTTLENELYLDAHNNYNYIENTLVDWQAYLKEKGLE